MKIPEFKVSGTNKFNRFSKLLLFLFFSYLNSISAFGQEPCGLILDCSGIFDITVEFEEDTLISPIVLDSCGLTSLVVQDTEIYGGSGCCSDPYIIERTYTVTDDNSTPDDTADDIVENCVQSIYFYYPDPVFCDEESSCSIDCSSLDMLYYYCYPCVTAPYCYSEPYLISDGGICNLPEFCSCEVETFTLTWVIYGCFENDTLYQTLTLYPDTDPPYIYPGTVPLDTTVQCLEDVPLARVKIIASDGCDDEVDISSSESRLGPNFIQTNGCNDIIVRTWTATDNCGNTDVATQYITIMDSIPPDFLSVPLDIMVTCNAIPPAEMATAMDNCDSNVVVQMFETRLCLDNYEIHRTYVATDNCGNSSTYTQIITVQDAIPPVLSATPQDITIICAYGLPPDPGITATDNCDTSLTVVYTPATDCTNDTTVLNTWSVMDCSGNITIHTQAVTIVDSSAPDMDNDGVADTLDINPLNPFICQDLDGDGCDDCTTGVDGLGPLPDYNTSTDGPDLDGDGLCNSGDPDKDNDGVENALDENPVNPFICQDLDGDGCDDCTTGVDGFGPLPDYNTSTDGQDLDGDGLCNSGDPDKDNDGVENALDENPVNPYICQDLDGDGCDDCTTGVDGFGPLPDYNTSTDGPDLDGDGLCNSGDPDKDNDGVENALDENPVNPYICQDLDGDGCDDCSTGVDGFGPLPDYNTSTDGPDLDGDGLCNSGDPDKDNDGVENALDENPVNPFICQDLDGDGCDDCTTGVDGFGPLPDYNTSTDGPDLDGDGLCNSGDPDKDNDGVENALDENPVNPYICQDLDGDGCDDCSTGVDGFGPLPDYNPFNDGADADNDGICDLADTCPLFLLLGSTHTTGNQLFEAESYIHSTEYITGNANVTYSAGMEVFLGAGFEVTAGATLEVYILGCQ